jgi:hypothetical protein
MSGSSPNRATTPMGSSTCVTILLGSGRLGGIAVVRPKGKPNVAARMIGHDQCAALWDPAQIPHLRTEVMLRNGPEDADDPLGEERVPFGDCRVRISAVRDELQRCHVGPLMSI